LKVEDFENLPGKGVKGEINNKIYCLGGENLLKSFNLTTPKIETIGTTTYLIDENKNILGAIILEDEIREESFSAIKELHKLGVKTAMITGDKKEVAEKVAKELGIDEYFAEVLPQEKLEKVKELQKRNLKVMFVGDGINDAPALMQADVGVAIGAGTNVAIESAGIILVRNDPRDIVSLIKLSRATYRKMIENLFWASGYNIVAIPLAAGILAFKGILLSPALGAIFMSLSTIIVAINALRLKNASLN
jgi:Cu2+-exporting ATPase